MNWTHLHLALNHLPVLGVPFIGLVLIIAIIRRDVVWQKLSFWGYVALFWVTLAAKTTGDFAHEQVAKWPDFEQGVMKVHEESADQAVTSVFLLGLVSGVALFSVARRSAVAEVEYPIVANIGAGKRRPLATHGKPWW